MKQLIFLIIFLCSVTFSFSQGVLKGVTNYQLSNGLTIILNEDQTASEVFGCVLVKTGARNDASNATGMAHYLEHMMFKGTTDLGTIDWESEKPHYLKLIDLFEDLRETDDADKQKEIYAAINNESKEAGKYAVPNEFSNLIQAIGGTGLNASTGYDQTRYYSFFPSFEVERWLEIYSHLFQKPVFRNFLTEVETVYEEKNMYANNASSRLSEEINGILYEGHPYSIPIIGTTEHLKHPSLKEMINFYQKWYVPSNMALILSGNINVNDVKPLIEQTFGKWEEDTKPTVSNYEIKPIEGKKDFKFKLTPYKIGIWAFNGIPLGHKDEIVLDMAVAMLNNSNKIGLFDRLATEGQVSMASVNSQAMLDGGRILIQAVPAFDRNQYRQLSVSETEKIIFAELEKLKNGEFEEWIFEAVKKQMLQDLELLFENPDGKASYLMRMFLENKPLNAIETMKEEIESIDKSKIVEIANIYFNNNYYTFQCLEGIGNSEKVKKPEFDIIEPQSNGISEFQKKFRNIKVGEINEKYLDLDKEMIKGKFTDGVNLYYKKNKKNNIFTLTIRYGVGARKLPSLAYAVSLMNKAGVMAQYNAQEFKYEMAKNGCKLNFYVSDDYTYVEIEGDENNLETSCRLLSKVMLLPLLDQKQMDATIGNAIISRQSESKQNAVLTDAMQQYLLYGNKSSYIDRLSEDDLNELTIKGLTGDFLKAVQYEADVHYYGNLDYDSVLNTLKQSLAFADGLNPSQSPGQTELSQHDKDVIYFVNDKNATQSNIYFFINEGEYKLDETPLIAAFNQYFGGGFNGLVLQEIREYRSFAYTASGGIRIPSMPGLKKYFLGYIGTQGDKTCDALETYVSLLKEMPQKPERIDNIRNYLINSTLTGKPSSRNTTQVISNWFDKGYKDDPSKVLIPQYRGINFEDILTFYENNIKDKPFSIAIVGNEKEIDMSRLKKIAKVEKVSTSTIFD